MHIFWQPSFFFKHRIGAPHGELLGLINPLSNFCSCVDNFYIFDSATLVAAEPTLPTTSIVRFVIIATVAPTLLASQSRINNLGLLARALRYLSLNRLPFPHRLQINLPPASPSYHIL